MLKVRADIERKLFITHYNKDFLRIVKDSLLGSLKNDSLIIYTLLGGMERNKLLLDTLYRFFEERLDKDIDLFRTNFTPEVINLLIGLNGKKEGIITFDQLGRFYDAVIQHKDDLGIALNQLLLATNNIENGGPYDVGDIIQRYEENKWHLDLMASEDPNGLVIERVDNKDFVSFAQTHYDIDSDEVDGQLEDGSADQQEFRVDSGCYEEDQEEDEIYDEEHVTIDEEHVTTDEEHVITDEKLNQFLLEFKDDLASCYVAAEDDDSLLGDGSD